MSKGKRRNAQKAKKARKAEIHKAGGKSKYAAKKAMSSHTPNSPFFFDPNNPLHETTEQARGRERRQREEEYEARLRTARIYDNEDPR